MQRGAREALVSVVISVDVDIIFRTTVESIFGLKDWSVVENFIVFLVLFLRVL
jgi:hypothetical protein